MANLPYVIPYDADFLGGGFRVPMPTPRCTGVLLNGGTPLDYIHFSLVMHKDRKSALFTAHNIDGAARHAVPRTGWDLDIRASGAQLGPQAYANNDWDRGHLVRRAAVAWGSTKQRARDASDATFYYTNASPQHKKFNQDEWLHLEDWVLGKSPDTSNRLCVFTGPLFTKVDLIDDGTRIPAAFWKVVVLRDPTAPDHDDLSVIGFAMKQADHWDDWGSGTNEELKLYQVGVRDLGEATGLDFGFLNELDEFEFRQPRFRDRSRMHWIRIEGPDDIEFFGERRRRIGIRAIPIRPVGDDDHSAPGIRAATSESTGGCGCGGETADMSETVRALSEEVTALRDTLEALLDERDGSVQLDAAAPGMRSAQPDAVQDSRDRLDRIVGGRPAAPGAFEDCACLGNDDESYYFCTGVLVRRNVVLTAGHCTGNITHVFLGGTSIYQRTDDMVFRVKRVVLHPDYAMSLVPAHDIAVVILEEDVALTPVELATRAEVDGSNRAELVGFGYNHPTYPTGFGRKRRVNVPVHHPGQPDAGDPALLGYDKDFEIHAGRKYLGKDSCNGDSGGPNYVDVDGTWKLAALTSRAAQVSAPEPCGHGGIYTRITPYAAWLAEVTGDDSFLSIAEGGDAPVVIPAHGGCSGGQVGSPGWAYISAAMPNPASTDAGNEWVELTNPGDTALHLTGFHIADRQNGRHALTGVIGPKQSRQIILPANSAVKFGNKGDDIRLLKDDEVLHEVSYTGAGSGELFTFAQPTPPTDPTGDPTDPTDPADPGTPWMPDADPC